MTEILAQVNTILPQLDDFITQFYSLISDNNINVITDSFGNMSIEVPQDIGNEDAEKFSKKVGILDRLITTQNKNLEDLFKRAYILEKSTSDLNNNYKLTLDEKMKIYQDLISKYRH